LTPRRKVAKILGLAVARTEFSCQCGRKKVKTWRLGGFALSSLVSDLELLRSINVQQFSIWESTGKKPVKINQTQDFSQTRN